MAFWRSTARASIPSLQEVAVIALAAQRVARAISTDSISEPLRDRLDEWARRTQGRPSGGLAHTVAELAGCPVCTGWWASLAMSAVWPGSARVRRGLSVAGAQVMLALLERLISEEGRAAIHQADIKQLDNAELSAASPAVGSPASS